MSGSDASKSRLVAAFYPYGSGPSAAECPPGAGPPLALGAAAVVDRDRGAGFEHYRLVRAGDEWLLHATAFGADRLVARARAQNLPEDPADAALALLLELWSLRQPRRLRYAAAAECGGALTSRHWRVLDEQLQPPLEDRLRTEGHEVLSLRGPMNTREHLLLFRRPSANDGAPQRVPARKIAG